MKHSYSFFISILLGCVIFGCTKHNGDVEEEQTPTASLTFAKPTEGAVYHPGDSVLIEALATAANEMHGYEVSIRNAADTAVVYFSQHVHAHGDTFAISHGWKDTLTTTTDLQVDVTLTLDHDGHTSRKSVRIKSEK